MSDSYLSAGLAEPSGHDVVLRWEEEGAGAALPDAGAEPVDVVAVADVHLVGAAGPVPVDGEVRELARPDELGDPGGVHDGPVGGGAVVEALTQVQVAVGPLGPRRLQASGNDVR